jgi:tRNA modification GTPase
MDLTRAEAVNEIVRSRTDRARALALERLGGAIESRVRAARDALVGLRASLEVMIDYPDDETVDTMDANALETAVRLLEGLTRSYRQGRVYQEGAAVVIAGATNSGKSSLFNLLLRQERAIVSEIHGTTRDWLEATVSIEGIPVRLFDTAGMRPSSDPLEIEGIRRTEQVIERADALVFMVDGVRGQSSGDIDFLSRHDGGVPVIKVWNKADLPDLRPTPEGFLPASASSGQGLEHIEQEIASAVLGGAAAETGEPLIDSARQRDLLDRSLAALARFREARAGDLTPDLLAVDLSEALDALGEITGEVTTAEILERMFADFCVGK